MDKLEENIKRVVAHKALNDIHKIVDTEDQKEKNEWHWAKISLTIILSILLVLMVLKLKF